MNLWLIPLFLFTNKVETSNDTLFISSLPEIEISSTLPIRGDVVLLAKLINGEAPYEPYEGQLAVASVVVNRMAYMRKDLSSVVFQRGQFDGVRSKRFKTWTREQYKIAYKALVAGQTNIPSSVLFFHNKKTSTDTKWVKTLRKYEWKQIGGHMFCHSKWLLKRKIPRV